MAAACSLPINPWLIQPVPAHLLSSAFILLIPLCPCALPVSVCLDLGLKAPATAAQHLKGLLPLFSRVQGGLLLVPQVLQEAQGLGARLKHVLRICLASTENALCFSTCRGAGSLSAPGDTGLHAWLNDGGSQENDVRVAMPL